MAVMRRRPPDLLIMVAIFMLLVVGIVAVGSASTPEALKLTLGKDPFLYGKRQIFSAITGIGLMLFAMRIDYRRYKKMTWPLAAVAIISLIAVLIVGRNISGATRWIDLKFIRFQPSEIAKLSVIFFLAHYLSELGNGVKRLIPGVIIPLAYTTLIGFLIMKEPDFGTTISIFVVFFAMLFAAGVRMLHLSGFGVLGVIASAILIKMEPYRLKRLTSFANPNADPHGSGWQILNSLYAIGSGGLFGLGFGRSRQKFFYLPEPHTDYIYAIIGEELGLIGTTTVLALFLFLAWRGFRAAVQARDTYGSLLAVGITSYIVFQAILNIAVVTASLPATGITLPLISYGGTSLWITLVSLGVLLNISKGGEVTREG